MRLYSGMSRDFIRDTTRNQIAGTLEGAFFQYFRYKPSPSEVQSWRNSLRAMAMVVDSAQLHDHGVLLEYQLPLSSKRLDCLITGHDQERAPQAVIVELKQWERCESSTVDKVVVSWLGGRAREVLHPSVQVGQYKQYLEDSHTAFHEGTSTIQLNACSYLHNYAILEDDPIRAPKFDGVLKEYPLFSLDDTEGLSAYLTTRLSRGDGRPVLDRIEQSPYRPSRKLMEHVSEAIRARPPWILLDEQLVVYEKILATVRDRLGDRKKQLVIIRGGPGTGKSVIAINLIAELLRQEVNAHYATGSKAFTETLWSLLGSRSKAMFKYFNSYGDAEAASIDVLVCDESHRIRETSNNRFTRRADRRTTPQLHELVQASKVTVFLIDDRQVVRPNEIGSSDYIKAQAEALNAQVSEYELDVQFRCSGSQGFVNWINNTLGIERTANVLWDGAEGFDFQIFDSPHALDRAIRAKADAGFSARVAAGFCWPWSVPRPDGTLEDDVVIGDYKRPWDAKPGSKNLAPGIPSASLWATDPNGIDQVGCVYNIQGFELDYIGVIWGRDLVYSFDNQDWVGDKKESADQVVKRSKDRFVELVKNTYRVLLSRGMTGCYVYFMDRDTERFVRSRMERVVIPRRTLRKVQPRPEERYVTCVPLVSFQIAAGGFGEPRQSDEHEWVEVDCGARLHAGMFVAQVTGHSMEPLIPDGSYCLFSTAVSGSRQGKVVVVELQDGVDPESGERYTVKCYESEKTRKGSSWEHTRIILRPINSDLEPIVLTPGSEGSVRLIAEFVAIVGARESVRRS